MKVLIVGGGGREHALAWRLVQSPNVSAILASPGNPGIVALGKCIPAPATLAGYAELAEAEAADLTVVGPEAPLVAGIVDLFRARGLKVIGPTQAAARLEGSKIFAKQFFARAGIPTARSVQAASFEEGLTALKSFSLPVVIKADGLAAGKGVMVAGTEAEAKDAIHTLGPLLVIEEFLSGEEVSFIGLSTGAAVLPFPASQDHKRVGDGDTGPNTGGMGSYVDGRILTPKQNDIVMDEVMLPAIYQMAKDGTPFTGFLYAGLMMTEAGPRLLEFNVRLGDPETQTLMYSFEGDLAPFLLGESAPSKAASLTPSVCIVLAAAGYPGTPQTGARITGIEAAEATGATVFHAGTSRSRNGELLVSGGRVLGVTAGGSTLSDAIAAAYTAVDEVSFAGAQYRRDIGRKGLRRW